MNTQSIPRGIAREGGALLAALSFVLIAAAGATAADWPTYNGPLGGDRYSPLAEITTSNVSQLRMVCAFGFLRQIGVL